MAQPSVPVHQMILILPNDEMGYKISFVGKIVQDRPNPSSQHDPSSFSREAQHSSPNSPFMGLTFELLA